MESQQYATRAEIEALFCGLADQLTAYYTQGDTRVILSGENDAVKPLSASGIEGFSRILYAEIPYTIRHGSNAYSERFVRGLIAGTDPAGENYWGQMSNMDQRVAEMVPVALMLFFCKRETWDMLTAKQQQGVLSYFRQANNVEIPQNNWLLFRALLNTIGRKLGDTAIDSHQIKRDLARIDSFYLGEGWYTDGQTRLNHTNIDYYTAWGFHFYGLLYAKIDPDGDHARVFSERAACFAKTYPFWFSPEGDAIPYGRSQIYRFAQVAFWSAAVFCGIDLPCSIGVVKGIILRNIRWWFTQCAITESGILSLGYGYPNRAVAEGYSSLASPYWAMKAFLILGIDDKDVFWSAKEEPLPALDSLHVDPTAQVSIVRDGLHVALFPAGKRVCGKDYAAKYNKFVYSNLCGFSIPRDHESFGAVAADSTLVYSDGDAKYIVRDGVDTFRIEADGSQASVWSPARGVTIRSVIIPGLPWHIRIHQIRCRRKIVLHDCGFSMPDLDERFDRPATPCGGTENICTSALSLDGFGKIESIKTAPRTNLIFEHSKMFAVTTALNPGTHLLIHAFYAARREKEDEQHEDPHILRQEAKRIVLRVNAKEITLPMNHLKIPLRCRLKRALAACLRLKRSLLIKEK